MMNIGRITTYPTDRFNKVGFHPYEIGNLRGFTTYYVSPNLDGIPFDPKGVDKVKRFPFFLEVYPISAGVISKIIFLIRRIFSIIVFSIKTISYLSNKDLSIVHIHSPMYSLIALWAKIFNKKVFITFHGEDFNKIKNSFLYKISKFLYDGVFAISPTMLTRLKEIHGDNVILVGNGIESEFKNFNKTRLKQIVFVGSFKKVKGHSMMIDGFELFLKKKPDFKLLFAGDGPLFNEMRDYVEAKGIKSNVVFLGHKTKQELIEIYNQSLVFALNSFSEGFPKVILEAIACGCRIISTKVGSVPNILGEDYPYFIEKHNPNYISEVLEKVVEAGDSTFVKYSDIINNYSWDSVRKIYRDVYLKEKK